MSTTSDRIPVLPYFSMPLQCLTCDEGKDLLKCGSSNDHIEESLSRTQKIDGFATDAHDTSRDSRFCKMSGCKARARSGFDFCCRHNGGKRCSKSGCNRLVRSKGSVCSFHSKKSSCAKPGCNALCPVGSRFCRHCLGDHRTCITPSCQFKQRSGGFCARCNKARTDNTSKGLRSVTCNDATTNTTQGTKLDNIGARATWCDVFPSFYGKRSSKWSRFNNKALNEEILKWLPCRFISTMSLVCKAANSVMKELQVIPFKKGDILELSTTRLPGLKDKQDNSRLTGHLDVFFMKVVETHAQEQKITLQSMDWRIAKTKDKGELVRPKTHMNKKQTICKKVKRSKPKTKDGILKEVYSPRAFYVKFIKPRRDYRLPSRRSDAPLTRKSLERRFKFV